MTPAQAQEVAEQLECPVELLGLLPQILQDFEELGSDADTAIELLRRLESHGLEPGPETHVLVLACGKGGLAVPIAQNFGCQVHGVDLMPAFIEAANDAAREAGVEKLCRFVVKDAHDALTEAENHRPHDGLIYAATGLFDGPADTMANLRRAVRPGGWIFIDDGFVADADVAARAPEHYNGYLDREATRTGLDTHGDRILVEYIYARGQLAAAHHREAALIRQRGEEVAVQYPEHAELIRRFVADQVAAYEFLSKDFCSAAWIIARS